MLTSSTLNTEPLHVHLTASTTKCFIDHYGFMEQIKKFKFKFKKGLVSFPTLLTINVLYLEAHILLHRLSGSISVAARSKAWVYGRSLVGIVGSNPAGGMNVEFCQAEVSATDRSLVQRSPTACVCV